jgi:hypothetical protein
MHDLSIAKRIDADRRKLDRAIERSHRELDGDHDMVDSPAHYHIAGVEVVDIQREVVSHYDGMMAFHVGCVIKYILRSPFKGAALQDLEKAHKHLSWAIQAGYSGD